MKRNITSFFSLVAFCILIPVWQAHSGDVYKQELIALKTRPDANYIFDKKIDPDFAALHRDIENYKELSYLQRLVRLPFMLSDAVVVTDQTMPTLYAYVDTLCKKNNIATPTIFISTKKSIFNAFAAKLFTSTGGILICQKFLLETSDREFEAVVAHEIGHIKHNHSNKTLLLTIGLSIPVSYGINYLCYQAKLKYNMPNIFMKDMLNLYTVSLITSLIINKRFEKEADEFACKEADKAPGLIELFERIEAKDVVREKEYQEACLYTEKVLEDNKTHISNSDLFSLKFDFSMIKVRHKMMNAYKWMYHNTFIGAHPSSQARITAAQKYVVSASQE